MLRAAVGLDGREGDRAVGVGPGLRLGGALAAIVDRLLPRLLGVKHGQRKVLHAVAVLRGLARGLAVLGERALEDDADVALREQIHRTVARAGREVGDLLDLEAKRARVEERGLLGDADIEAHMVDIDQLKRIGRGRGSSGRTERGHRVRF